jgi:hypothetical protein
VDRRQQGPVEKATRAELRKLGASVQTESLPATAVALARQIDSARGGMAAAAVAAQLRLIIADVAKSAVRPDKDAIDELNARPAVLRVVKG